MIAMAQFLIENMILGEMKSFYYFPVMKNTVILLFAFFGSICLPAQNPSSDPVRSPKIICSVKLGDSAGFGNRSVKFVKVISDSRCPKNVTCVWAGEAKILIEIYTDGKLEEIKEVVVSAKTVPVPLFSLKNNSVAVDGVDPYPDAKTPEANKKYELELIMTKGSE